ncbi:MAG: carboxypeptidase regulatory-like domain-containing protein, partial [Planctomycetes bacterium]|nr:carboxypeptidase regulatory-like domain-containing protein [Planctomycetota bacterium]
MTGHYLVVLGGEAYRREELQVDLAATPQVQQRDFVVHAGMRFPIRVVDASGASPLGPPDSEATRRAWSLTVRATRSAPLETVNALSPSTNELSECGEFNARHLLEPGEANLGADALGLLTLSQPPPLFVSLAFGNRTVATQRIEELPKELVFTVDPEMLRSLLAGVRLRLVQADGRTPLVGGSLTLSTQNGAGGQVSSDADGRAEFLERIPGAYEIRLASKGRALQGRSVVLEPGQVLDLGDIAMREGSMQFVRFEYPG